MANSHIIVAFNTFPPTSPTPPSPPRTPARYGSLPCFFQYGHAVAHEAAGAYVELNVNTGTVGVLADGA